MVEGVEDDLRIAISTAQRHFTSSTVMFLVLSKRVVLHQRASYSKFRHDFMPAEYSTKWWNSMPRSATR
jgi:hypothetical protein